MFCPKCGKLIEEGSIFCPECGAKIEDIQTIPSITQVVEKPAKPIALVFIIFYTIWWGILLISLGTGAIISARIGLPLIEEIRGGLFWEKIEEIMETKRAILSLGIGGFLILLYGIFGLTAAYGLWFLKEWGRKLAIILYILYIPLAFLSLIGQRLTVSLIIFILIGISISCVIIWYLSYSKRLFQE